MTVQSDAFGDDPVEVRADRVLGVAFVERGFMVNREQLNDLNRRRGVEIIEVEEETIVGTCVDCRGLILMGEYCKPIGERGEMLVCEVCESLSRMIDGLKAEGLDVVVDGRRRRPS